MIFNLFNTQKPVTWHERGKVVLSFFFNYFFYKLDELLKEEKLSQNDKAGLAGTLTMIAAKITKAQALKEYQNGTTSFPVGFIWEEFERGLNSIFVANAEHLAELEDLRSIFQSVDSFTESDAMQSPEKSGIFFLDIIDKLVRFHWQMRAFGMASNLEEKFVVANDEVPIETPFTGIIFHALFSHLAGSLRLAIFTSDAEAREWLNRLPPNLQNINEVSPRHSKQIKEEEGVEIVVLPHYRQKKKTTKHLLGTIPGQGKSKGQLVEEAIKLLESKGVKVSRDLPLVSLIERLEMEEELEKVSGQIIKNIIISAPDALHKLTPREQKILKMRFGLNGHHAHTLKETAAEFGLSVTNIRKEILAGIDKIV